MTNTQPSQVPFTETKVEPFDQPIWDELGKMRTRRWLAKRMRKEMERWLYKRRKGS